MKTSDDVCRHCSSDGRTEDDGKPWCFGMYTSFGDNREERCGWPLCSCRAGCFKVSPKTEFTEEPSSIDYQQLKKAGMFDDGKFDLHCPYEFEHMMAQKERNDK